MAYIQKVKKSGNTICIRFDSADTANRMYDKVIKKVGKELRK